MDPIPAPIQSSEIDSSSSAIPSSFTSALPPPVADDNQTLNSLNNPELMQNQATQNPSSPIAESDPLQIPQTQFPESKHPDPPSPEPDNFDHDLQQPDLEDPDDQEGTIYSPSHMPLPSMTASRRAPSRRGKRRTSKNNYFLQRKRIDTIEKKSRALAENLKVIPFIPSKALDFSKYEAQVKRLGLWDFVHLEFDRKIRVDLVAKLAVSYNDKTRSSQINDVKIKMSQADFARAMCIPKKSAADCGEEDWPVDFISFLDDFLSCWVLLHEDTWMLPDEVRSWTRHIKEGHPEKVDWSRLIWFMVKREISQGMQLECCYYASHLQLLVKAQKEGLLEEKSSDEVKEIMVVKDDEEDEGNAKMAECDKIPCVGEPESNHEATDEGVHAQSDVNMEETIGDAEKVDSLVRGDVATDEGVLVESQNTTGNEVEDSKRIADQVQDLKSTGDHVEELEIAVNHAENVEPNVVRREENVETTVVDHVDNIETTTVDHVESVEATLVDHVEKVETTLADHVETIADPAQIGENACDPAQIVENTDDHVENMTASGDGVEKMNIHGYHVEDEKASGYAMEDVKPEPTDVIPDDAEIHETGCNDLIDFEDCKVDEPDPWDLSRKDIGEDHFLSHCNSLSGPQVNANQANAQHLEDDDNVQGFDILQKCNNFNGLSSGHLMQTIDSSQNPYAAPDFDNHHMMLGGPSSLFGNGNSSKRGFDLDSEISLNETHKRMKTEAPPDLEVCFDQMQQWMEKSRMACMSSHQTMVNQHQMFLNELGSKDQLIQQLKLTNNELQRRRQSEINRYENELYTMSSVIDGYRKALRKTQEAFAEYRKCSNLAAEPLYRDAGPGGVVKSVAQLERERLVREEKEKVAVAMVERFEEEWKIRFEGHVGEAEKLGARVCEIGNGVELLRESAGKRKASENVG